jgi:hypothetical protein
MTAILLIIFLAYNLFQVWHDRGLQPELRQRLSPGFLFDLLHAAFFNGLGITTRPVPP